MLNKIIWCDAGWLPHYYGFCPSKRAWDALAKISKRDLGRYPPPDPKACCTLFRNYKDGKRTCIVTVGDHSPAVTVDLLIHEAMHVWRDMLEAIEEEKPSSEFEAYAMQNITANLFHAYEQTRSPLFLKRCVNRPLP